MWRFLGLRARFRAKRDRPLPEDKRVSSSGQNIETLTKKVLTTINAFSPRRIKVPMKMIVGLGNPGQKYAGSKHNMGFMVVDGLAKRLNLTIDKLEFDAATATTRLNGEKTFLVKPQTFMNASGRAVRELMMFYQIQLDEIFVVQDDMDLTLGKLRLRKRGSAGGHNGIKDIISATGSDEFCRLKIGIQHPQRQRVVDWVLTPFSKTDQPLIDDAIEKADDALEDWLNGMPFDQLMNKFN